MAEAQEEIARLEREIEALSDREARCLKLDVAARAAMAGGGLWLGAAVLGLVRGDAALSLVAIAALMGGIVLFGSNRASWRQFAVRREAAEARRAALIDGLGLRALPGDVRRLH